jgi:hypothetical protein
LDEGWGRSWMRARAPPPRTPLDPPTLAPRTPAASATALSQPKGDLVGRFFTRSRLVPILSQPQPPLPRRALADPWSHRRHCAGRLRPYFAGCDARNSSGQQGAVLPSRLHLRAGSESARPRTHPAPPLGHPDIVLPTGRPTEPSLLTALRPPAFPPPRRRLHFGCTSTRITPSARAPSARRRRSSSLLSRRKALNPTPLPAWRMIPPHRQTLTKASSMPRSTHRRIPPWLSRRRSTGRS